MIKPEAVFKSLKERHLIEEICKSKGIPVMKIDEPRKSASLIKDLVADCNSKGFFILLQQLKVKTLKFFVPHVQFEDDKIPTNKSVLIKRIHDHIMDLTDREGFFSKLKEKELEEICKEIEVDADTKSEMVEALVGTAIEYGLENCFSSFSETKLQKFAEAAGLKVQSSSVDVLTECLIRNEDFKKEKKKAKPPQKASKKKPKLKEGISAVDLHTHYVLAELIDYCKEHDIDHIGKKSELMKRVLAHLEGKPIPQRRLKNKRKSKRKASSDTESDKPKKKAKKSDDDITSKSDNTEDEKKEKQKKVEEKSEEKGKKKK